MSLESGSVYVRFTTTFTPVYVRPLYFIPVQPGWVHVPAEPQQRVSSKIMKYIYLHNLTLVRHSLVMAYLWSFDFVDDGPVYVTADDGSDDVPLDKLPVTSTSREYIIIPSILVVLCLMVR